MAYPTMTVAIASCQRRAPLLRLLRSLDEQAESSSDLLEGLDVVVVLDGSTDGSHEAVEDSHFSVPIRVIAQDNRGLASARNAGLSAARGETVWFLDDDLVAGPGLLERHRREHGSDPAHILVGPCRIPPGADAPEDLTNWWDEHYAMLERAGVVDRFDRFTMANTSGPVALFRDVGGLDERFVDYGFEDYEFGFRLLSTGVGIRFDAGAIAWHPDVAAPSSMISRNRSIARNAVRLVHLHPEATSVVFPGGGLTPEMRLLRRLRLRSPASLGAVSSLAGTAARRLPRRLAGVRRRATRLAGAAAYAAGVAEADTTGELLATVLGHP